MPVVSACTRRALVVWVTGARRPGRGRSSLPGLWPWPVHGRARRREARTRRWGAAAEAEHPTRRPARGAGRARRARSAAASCAGRIRGGEIAFKPSDYHVRPRLHDRMRPSALCQQLVCRSCVPPTADARKSGRIRLARDGSGPSRIRPDPSQARIRIRPVSDPARAGFGPSRIRPGSDSARLGSGQGRVRDSGERLRCGRGRGDSKRGPAQAAAASAPHDTAWCFRLIYLNPLCVCTNTPAHVNQRHKLPFVFSC